MFYIVEQGARIATPIDQLLKTKAVTKLTATAKIKALDASDDSPQLKTAVSTAYQDDLPEKPRNRVIYARQIMSSPVVTASSNQRLNDIWGIFSKHQFHHLPLLDDQHQLQGIVSDRDILRFAANKNDQLGSQPIRKLMTRQVITADIDTEVRSIAELMCQSGIGAIPIVDDTVSVVGIVSRSDILRTLVNRAPLELWV